jgi:putative GTP pyrophosphokinase
MAFSKGEVNRAGEVVAKQIREAVAGRKPDALDEVEQFARAVEVVDWWRGEHARPLTLIAANLRNYAAEVGPPVVAQRLKRLPTIAGKLVREPKMKLARMGDIGGVRAVVPDQDAANYVAKRLRKNWTITRFSDYVAEPKADGYRALHLINRHRGRLIEVQIRTQLQDGWANVVEGLTRSVAPGLKFGAGPPQLRRLVADLASLDADFESGNAAAAQAVYAKLREIRLWVDNFMEEQNDEP